MEEMHIFEILEKLNNLAKENSPQERQADAEGIAIVVGDDYNPEVDQNWDDCGLGSHLIGFDDIQRNLNFRNFIHILVVFGLRPSVFQRVQHEDNDQNEGEHHESVGLKSINPSHFQISIEIIENCD